MQFIDRMTPSPATAPQPDKDINDEWNEYVEEQREQELMRIIKEENLREKETCEFIAQSFADGFVTTTALAITKVMPPCSSSEVAQSIVKQRNMPSSTNSPHSSTSITIFDLLIINISMQSAQM